MMWCTAVPLFLNKDELPRNINVTVGGNVTLRCDAYAEPPADITWMRNAQPLDRQFELFTFIVRLDCVAGVLLFYYFVRRIS